MTTSTHNKDYMSNHPEAGARYRLLTSLATLVARLLVLPDWLIYQIERPLAGELAARIGMSERMAKWPGMLGIIMRRALINVVCRGTGENLSVGTGTLISKWTATFGNNVYIGRLCVVGDAAIGDDVMIGDHVHIVSGGHGFDQTDKLLRFQTDTERRVTIGADTWIGSGAIILADVGSHTVVGAGSVVTKPMRDYQIVVGNPARSIRDRRDNKETM